MTLNNNLIELAHGLGIGADNGLLHGVANNLEQICRNTAPGPEIPSLLLALEMERVGKALRRLATSSSVVAWPVSRERSADDASG